MMNISMQLRVVLIIGGIVLLVVIYLWGRGGGSKKAVQNPSADEPTAFEPEDESVAAVTEQHGDAFSETVVVDDASWEEARTEADSLPEVRVHHLDELEPQADNGRREPMISEEFTEAAADNVASAPLAPAVEAPTLSEVVPAASAPEKPAATQLGARPSRSAAEVKAAPQRKIVALRLSVDRGLQGVQLLHLLQSAGLQFGKFDIFHRMQSGASVFSVASMVEPGSFDLKTLTQTQYPGVTLFVILPGPTAALSAFDQMLIFGQRLQQVCGGLLQDERGQPITTQIIARLRDEVLEFERSLAANEAAH